MRQGLLRWRRKDNCNGNERMFMSAKSVTDSSFESDVLKAKRPVLVDFWAEWCGPCKMLLPTVEELAGEYKGKVDIVKVNIDENPETPAKYGVRGIPTLMLFENGEVKDTKVGGDSKSNLKSWIDTSVAA